MLKRYFQPLKQGITLLVGYALTIPVWADLPKPPDSDIANETSDWIDVGGSLLYKVMIFALIGLGAMILAGAAFGIFKAYHTAQEKQEISHFFKHLGVALGAAAIGAGMVYAGYAIITSNST